RSWGRVFVFFSNPNYKAFFLEARVPATRRKVILSLSSNLFRLCAALCERSALSYSRSPLP
ncbi:MAG: hypothetical protein P4M11_09480, partial [Candidatus Pacebacteria bacterium]|nr:hypothetical protein [Candidatus Paceibacterota bacterium]